MSTLIHLDSGDHYDTAQAYIKWFVAPTMVADGRTGKCWSGGDKVFNQIENNVFGFAVKGIPSTIIQLNNVAASVDLAIQWSGDSRFRASLGFAGDRSYSEWSPITICREDLWYYFEIKTEYSVVPDVDVWYFHRVRIEIRINEELILDTELEFRKFSSPPGFSRLTFGGNINCDDFYFTDDEYLGDIRIFVIRPNAEGDLNEWSSANGGANYLEVKDINPDFLTTYIYTSTLNQISLVNLEDISLVGTIKGIQFNAVCHKDDAGSASFSSYNKISGSYFEAGAAIFPSFESWLDRTIPYRVNPATSSDFTVAEINSLQAGVKRLT